MNLQKQINDITPLNRIQRSYIADKASNNDYMPLFIFDFKRLLEKDKELNEYYSIFKEFIQCKCHENECQLKKFLDILIEFSKIIGDELNSAFKAWYKLRR